MTNLKNINYNELPDKEKKKVQEQFHENDLNYFSSFALEANAIQEQDLLELNNKIDKRISSSWFNTNFKLLVSLGSGIIIGGALLFIWQYNNKNHATLFEETNLKIPLASSTSPKNSESNAANPNFNTPPLNKEHFNISESGEQLLISSPLENMEIKDINSIEVKPQPTTAQEEILAYIPNASVIFIHDMKVANYKTYYFKNTRNIDIRENGLSAQFANKEEASNNLNKRLQDRDYYAHEIIKDAMEAFNKKQFAEAISLLELLKNYNKDDVNTQFYLGMSYFNLADYTKALTYFEKAKHNDINIFLQESEFYTALSYKKTGKTKEANTLFKQIANMKLFYANRAAEELN